MIYRRCWLTWMVTAVLIGCIGSGCSVKTKQSPLAGAFFRNPEKPMAAIGRVALVTLDNRSPYPDISAQVTENLYIALQRKQHFGITTVAQDDPLWKGLQMAPDGTYVLDELVRMHDTLKCDAILSGVVTEYKPYPHLILGLRLSLVDLEDGVLIWGIEHVWSAADLDSSLRTASYLGTMPGKKSAQSEVLRMSPAEFAGFVAFEIAETLSDPAVQDDSGK